MFILNTLTNTLTHPVHVFNSLVKMVMHFMEPSLGNAVSISPSTNGYYFLVSDMFKRPVYVSPINI